VSSITAFRVLLLLLLLMLQAYRPLQQIT